MVLASAAVGVGLTMGGKLIKTAAPERRTIHEVLSLSALAALAVHGLALLGDAWLHPSLLQLTVPFTASYATLATSLGIIAGWGMAILGLSFYARKRIGQKRWRTVHRFTALAWLLALGHTFAEGTDTGKAWFVGLMLLTAGPALVLLIIRHARVSAGRPSVRGTHHVPQRRLEVGVPKLKAELS